MNATFEENYIPPGGKKRKISQIFRNVNLTLLNKTHKTHIENKKAVLYLYQQFPAKLKQSLTTKYCDFLQKM